MLTTAPAHAAETYACVIWTIVLFGGWATVQSLDFWNVCSLKGHGHSPNKQLKSLKRIGKEWATFPSNCMAMRQTLDNDSGLESLSKFQPIQKRNHSLHCKITTPLIYTALQRLSIVHKLAGPGWISRTSTRVADNKLTAFPCTSHNCW